VFAGDDVRQKLPVHGVDFDVLTEEWKAMTAKMHNENDLFKACRSECTISITFLNRLKPDRSTRAFLLKALFEHLNAMNRRSEAIQRALEVHVESKRHVFPRFYFISNRELLEILGNSTDPDSVQPHLKKLFHNVHGVKIVVRTRAVPKRIVRGTRLVQ